MGLETGSLAGELWRNSGGQVDISVETILLTLAYISFALRIWSRSIQRAQYQLNDWLIVFVMFLTTIRYAVDVAVVVKCGLGLHIADVVAVGGPNILVLFSQLIYAIEIVFVICVALIKLSILHFYSTIFLHRTFLVLIRMAMALCAVFLVASLIATILSCNPPQKKWYPDTPGHCLNDQHVNFAIGTTDFILDIVTFVLPLPILWKLQMPLMKKVGLSFIFGLGFAIIIITASRLQFFFTVTNDVTFTLWQAGVLSAVVPLLGIISANLPIMQPALKTSFLLFKDLGTTRSTTREANRKMLVGHDSRRFRQLPEDSICLATVEGENLSATACLATH
ncbi:hypothetical protein F5Y08DRAFT_19429 [Xylaria arbuscula]|nr:hypothetical protein F5Y08DRAFT_19429 [Xylaria arbuscula]